MHQNRGLHPRRLLTGFCLIAAGCLILPPLFIALAWSTRGLAHYRRAHELLADQAYEPAIDELERAARLDPSLAVGPRFAVAYHARGLARLEKKQYDGAIADLTSAVDLSKPAPDSYRRDLARAHRQRASWRLDHQADEQALDDIGYASKLDPTFTLDPKFASISRARGLALLEAKEYDKAIASLTCAVDLHDKRVPVSYRSDLARAHYQRACMRLDSQEYEPAIDDLVQASKLNRTLEYDLRLMLWGDGSGVPTSGNNLAIVGVQYFNDLPFYRIRWFDVGGNVREYDERASLGMNIHEEMAWAKQLSALLPPHEMTGAEKAEVTGIVTKIVGHPNLKFDPAFAVAFHARGLARLEAKEYDGAIADLFRAVTDSGLNDLPWWEDEFTAIVAGNGAESPGTSAPASYRSDLARAFVKRAYRYIVKSEYNKAAQDLGRAVRFDPMGVPVDDDFPDGPAQWGRMFGSDDSNMDKLTKAIEADPKNASLFIERGIKWFFERKYVPAINDFTEALRHEPRSKRAYYGRGTARIENKEPENAVADFKEALRIDHVLRETDEEPWEFQESSGGRHQ